jgi:predicted methyltransferase
MACIASVSVTSSKTLSGETTMPASPRGVLDQRRVVALGDELRALHDVRREDARGVEAVAVVDHDGRLLDARENASARARVSSLVSACPR